MNSSERNIRINIAKENKNIIIKKKYILNIHKPFKFNIYKKLLLNNKSDNECKIICFKGTTNQAINHVNNINSLFNIIVLNFANSHHVGGGYLHGSMAQEEELARTIIDLFPSLALRANKSYDYLNFKWYKHILYSSNLSLYRYDNRESKGIYNFIPNAPIKVSVVTAAAPDLNNNQTNINNFINDSNKFYKIIYNIIHTVCIVPLYINEKKNKKTKNNVLILGAFGCGAFSPSQIVQNKLNIKYNEVIASIFAQVLINIKKILYYDYIYFAIPPGDNYDAFYNILKSYNLFN